jgi:hypothetical protein
VGKAKRVMVMGWDTVGWAGWPKSPPGPPGWTLRRIYETVVPLAAQRLFSDQLHQIRVFRQLGVGGQQPGRQ